MSLSSSLGFALLSTLIAGAALESVAAADVETRDHRTQPSPMVSSGSTTGAVRYRRRPGPRLMMPLKVDLGWAGLNTERGFAQGIGGAVGIHWASLSPRPTNFDIGVGVFGALLGTPATTDGMDGPSGVAYGGAYLEAGHTLAKGSWWRTWATGRGEYLGSTAFGEDKQGVGASGRLSVELFASGVGIEPRGVFLGTYSLGLYGEVGVRDVVDGMGSVHANVGLTFRTPLVFAP